MQKNSWKEYECTKCNDLRFILKDNVATPCECKAIKEAKEIIKVSGISEGFRKMTFENFNYRLNHQTINSFSIATKYAKEFTNIVSSRNNSILFTGSVGTGKSHLSMAIANNLMEKGIGVIIMSYSQDIIKLKQSRMDRENYLREISKFKRAKVLLIDDLFKGSATESDKSIMFEIIDYRYFSSKPVIINTEKSCEELLNLDEAIGSRLIEMSEGYIVENKGSKTNYRLYKNQLNNQLNNKI